MMKNIALLLMSAVLLSACSADNDRSVDYVPVRVSSPDISLSTVRHIYRDSNVEVYDLNEYPSVYASQRQYHRSGPEYALNPNIPVKDRSVEVYDLGFATSASQSGFVNSAPPQQVIPQQENAEPTVPEIPLAPPSHAKSDFKSPFEVIEEDGMLTDPLLEGDAQTSVIVPMTEPQAGDDDDFELMTDF